MNEQTQEEGEKSTGTDVNNSVGNTPKSSSVLDRTDALVKRLEEANKVAERHLAKQEELYARQKLGGNSEAGKSPEKQKEESPEDYAERFYKGDLA